MRKGLLLMVAVALALGCRAGAGGTGDEASTGAARPFRDVVGAASASSYKVSYRVSSTAGGQAVSGTQTWYVSGSRFRMDLTGAGAGSISIFVTPEGTFSCLSGLGAPGAQCIGLGQTQAFAESPAAVFDAQIRADPDAFGATFRETRSIAGTSASCYGLTGTGAGFSQGTICYTTGGVPLLYQFDASGLSFTMEATSFGTPTDADFQLPAPPQRFGMP